MYLGSDKYQNMVGSGEVGVQYVAQLADEMYQLVKVVDRDTLRRMKIPSKIQRKITMLSGRAKAVAMHEVARAVAEKCGGLRSYRKKTMITEARGA